MVENKLEIIKKACEDKKGVDIEVIDIRGLSPIADYFVIASGSSSTQVTAIADEVEFKMAAYEEANFVKEGYQSGRWILLDYGDTVVHIFHKEEREFYDLDKLWKNYTREDN